MRSFKIYDKWLVQTNKQISIHIRVRNAVTLVWGSLKLAPITKIELVHSVGDEPMRSTVKDHCIP